MLDENLKQRLIDLGCEISDSQITVPSGVTLPEDFTVCDLHLYLSKGASAPAISKVSGDLILEEGASAPNVTEVGGRLILREGASAQNVTKVNGSLVLSPGTSVPNISEIGGGLHFHKGAFFPENLSTVKGDILFIRKEANGLFNTTRVLSLQELKETIEKYKRSEVQADGITATPSQSGEEEEEEPVQPLSVREEAESNSSKKNIIVNGDRLFDKGYDSGENVKMYGREYYKVSNQNGMFNLVDMTTGKAVFPQFVRKAETLSFGGHEYDILVHGSLGNLYDRETGVPVFPEEFSLSEQISVYEDAGIVEVAFPDGRRNALTAAGTPLFQQGYESSKLVERYGRKMSRFTFSDGTENYLPIENNAHLLFPDGTAVSPLPATIDGEQWDLVTFPDTRQNLICRKDGAFFFKNTKAEIARTPVTIKDKTYIKVRTSAGYELFARNAKAGRRFPVGGSETRSTTDIQGPFSFLNDTYIEVSFARTGTKNYYNTRTGERLLPSEVLSIRQEENGIAVILPDGTDGFYDWRTLGSLEAEIAPDSAVGDLPASDIPFEYKPGSPEEKQYEWSKTIPSDGLLKILRSYTGDNPNQLSIPAADRSFLRRVIVPGRSYSPEDPQSFYLALSAVARENILSQEARGEYAHPSDWFSELSLEAMDNAVRMFVTAHGDMLSEGGKEALAVLTASAVEKRLSTLDYGTFFSSLSIEERSAMMTGYKDGLSERLNSAINACEASPIQSVLRQCLKSNFHIPYDPAQIDGFSRDRAVSVLFEAFFSSPNACRIVDMMERAAETANQEFKAAVPLPYTSLYVEPEKEQSASVGTATGRTHIEVDPSDGRMMLVGADGHRLLPATCPRLELTSDIGLGFAGGSVVEWNAEGKTRVLSMDGQPLTPFRDHLWEHQTPAHLKYRMDSLRTSAKPGTVSVVADYAERRSLVEEGVAIDATDGIFFSPFTVGQKLEDGTVLLTEREANKAYADWLSGKAHHDFQQKRRHEIIDSILTGENYGKYVLYNKEFPEDESYGAERPPFSLQNPSPANVLSFFINHPDVLLGRLAIQRNAFLYANIEESLKRSPSDEQQAQAPSLETLDEPVNEALQSKELSWFLPLSAAQKLTVLSNALLPAGMKDDEKILSDLMDERVNLAKLGKNADKVNEKLIQAFTSLSTAARKAIHAQSPSIISANMKGKDFDVFTVHVDKDTKNEDFIACLRKTDYLDPQNVVVYDARTVRKYKTPDGSEKAIKDICNGLKIQYSFLPGLDVSKDCSDWEVMRHSPEYKQAKERIRADVAAGKTVVIIDPAFQPHVSFVGLIACQELEREGVTCAHLGSGQQPMRSQNSMINYKFGVQAVEGRLCDLEFRRYKNSSNKYVYDFHEDHPDVKLVKYKKKGEIDDPNAPAVETPANTVFIETDMTRREIRRELCESEDVVIVFSNKTGALLKVPAVNTGVISPALRRQMQNSSSIVCGSFEDADIVRQAKFNGKNVIELDAPDDPSMYQDPEWIDEQAAKLRRGLERIVSSIREKRQYQALYHDLYGAGEELDVSAPVELSVAVMGTNEARLENMQKEVVDVNEFDQMFMKKVMVPSGMESDRILPNYLTELYSRALTPFEYTDLGLDYADAKSSGNERKMAEIASRYNDEHDGEEPASIKVSIASISTSGESGFEVASSIATRIALPDVQERVMVNKTKALTINDGTFTGQKVESKQLFEGRYTVDQTVSIDRVDAMNRSAATSESLSHMRAEKEAASMRDFQPGIPDRMILYLSTVLSNSEIHRLVRYAAGEEVPVNKDFAIVPESTPDPQGYLIKEPEDLAKIMGDAIRGGIIAPDISLSEEDIRAGLETVDRRVADLEAKGIHSITVRSSSYPDVLRHLAEERDAAVEAESDVKFYTNTENLAPIEVVRLERELIQRSGKSRQHFIRREVHVDTVQDNEDGVTLTAEPVSAKEKDTVQAPPAVIWYAGDPKALDGPKAYLEGFYRTTSGINWLQGQLEAKEEALRAMKDDYETAQDALPDLVDAAQGIEDEMDKFEALGKITECQNVIREYEQLREERKRAKDALRSAQKASRIDGMDQQLDPLTPADRTAARRTGRMMAGEGVTVVVDREDPISMEVAAGAVEAGGSVVYSTSRSADDLAIVDLARHAAESGSAVVFDDPLAEQMKKKAQEDAEETKKREFPADYRASFRQKNFFKSGARFFGELSSSMMGVDAFIPIAIAVKGAQLAAGLVGEVIELTSPTLQADVRVAADKVFEQTPGGNAESRRARRERRQEQEKAAKAEAETNAVLYPETKDFQVFRYGNDQVFIIQENYPAVREAIREAYGEDAKFAASIAAAEDMIYKNRIVDGAVVPNGEAVRFDGLTQSVGEPPYVQQLCFFRDKVYSVSNVPSAAIDRPDRNTRMKNKEILDRAIDAAESIRKEMNRKLFLPEDLQMRYERALHILTSPAGVQVYAGDTLVGAIALDKRGNIRIFTDTPQSVDLEEHHQFFEPVFQRLSPDKTTSVAIDDMMDNLRHRILDFSLNEQMKTALETREQQAEKKQKLDNNFITLPVSNINVAAEDLDKALADRFFLSKSSIPSLESEKEKANVALAEIENIVSKAQERAQELPGIIGSLSSSDPLYDKYTKELKTLNQTITDGTERIEKAVKEYTQLDSALSKAKAADKDIRIRSIAAINNRIDRQTAEVAKLEKKRQAIITSRENLVGAGEGMDSPAVQEKLAQLENDINAVSASISLTRQAIASSTLLKERIARATVIETVERKDVKREEESGQEGLSAETKGAPDAGDIPANIEKAYSIVFMELMETETGIVNTRNALKRQPEELAKVEEEIKGYESQLDMSEVAKKNRKNQEIWKRWEAAIVKRSNLSESVKPLEERLNLLTARKDELCAIREQLRTAESADFQRHKVNGKDVLCLFIAGKPTNVKARIVPTEVRIAAINDFNARKFNSGVRTVILDGKTVRIPSMRNLMAEAKKRATQDYYDILNAAAAKKEAFDRSNAIVESNLQARPVAETAEKAAPAKQNLTPEQLVKAALKMSVKPWPAGWDMKKPVKEWNFAGAGVKEISGIEFQKVDLSGMDFSGIRFVGCTFTDCKLSGARFAGCELMNVSFGGADLTGADLTGATLVSSSLIKANLSGAVLNGIRMNDTDLSLCSLKDASLAGGAVLEDCLMDGTFLEGTNAEQAVFNACEMKNIVATNANLASANLMSSMLTDCDLTGANMTDTLFNTETAKDVRIEKTQKARPEEVKGQVLKGMQLIERNGLFAIADKDLVIRSDFFKNIAPYPSDTIAKVTLKNGKQQWLRPDGSYILPQPADTIYGMKKDGVILFSDEGRFFLYDARMKKYVSDNSFSMAHYFNDGWSLVQANEQEPQKHAYGKYNFINKDGKYLSNRWFVSAGEFNEGKAIVSFDGKNNFYISSDGLIQVKNDEGKDCKIPLSVYTSGLPDSDSLVMTSYYGNRARLPQDAFIVQTSVGAPEKMDTDFKWDLVMPNYETMVKPYKEKTKGCDPEKDRNIIEQAKSEYTASYMSAIRSRAKEIAEALNAIIEKAAGRPIFLMCFEKAGEFCHRNLLANFINTELSKKFPLKVTRGVSEAPGSHKIVKSSSQGKTL